MTIDIPTWEEVKNRKVLSNQGSAGPAGVNFPKLDLLEEFIYYHTPEDENEEIEFRKNLEGMLGWVIENHYLKHRKHELSSLTLNV